MVDRRDLLKGGSLIAASLQLGASAANTGFPIVAGPVEAFATIDALAASALEPGRVAQVMEEARGGLFTCVAGMAPDGDPREGIYVRAKRSGRYFARAWNGRVGRPEWFGAVVNDGTADCAPAIEACVAFCPVTELAQADYFIARTLVIDRSWRTLYGTGRYAADQGQGTRIVLRASAPGIRNADIMLVGSRQQPSRSNDGFPFEIHLSDFTLVRDGTTAPHASGDLRHYPAGLRAAYLTRCSFARIASLESAVGFYLGGLVYTKIDDCMAQRLRAGTGDGSDLSAGFYLDGSPDYGLAGGNASLYLNRCLVVGQHAHHVRPTGLVAEGAFVDSFVDGFESARIDNGMRFSAKDADKPTQTIDLHIRNCVLDGCGATGMEIDLAGTQAASIELIDPYIYAGGHGGAVGILVHDGAGLLTVTGGQVHGDFHDGSLALRDTRGVRIHGLKLHEGSRPMVVDRSGALQLEPQVMNLSRQTTAFAISCTGVYRAAIRPMVLGAAGMLGGGVALDQGCNYSSVDTSAVDQGCFSEVTAARKLWFAGRDATSAPGAAAFARQGNAAYGVLG
jgi:hypothetical protein